MKDYYKFQTEQMEHSKENIIYRLWFAEKQVESLKHKHGKLQVENQGLKIALQAFGNKVK